MGSTYLITGVAGLIGSHLAERLRAAGDRVVGVDNFNDYYDVDQKRANLAGLAGDDGFTLVEADIRDADALHRVVAAHRPRAVAHLAAMANVRYAVGRTPLYHEVNVSGTVNLLEAVLAAGVPHVVFASTSSVYGNTDRLPFREDDPADRPLSAYPATKRAGELLGHTYHHLHGISFTALRFFSVYGPRARPDMMPFIVTDRIARGESITLFNAGRMKRDWTYVGDIAAGVAAALERPLGYEVLNLGRGEPVLMADFVRLLEERIGRPAITECPPAPASEPTVTYADTARARRLLGYDPQTPVAEGLDRLWDWYRRRGAPAAR